MQGNEGPDHPAAILLCC